MSNRIILVFWPPEAWVRDKLAKWGVSEMLAVSNKCSCMDAFLGGLSIFVPERESPKEKRSGTKERWRSEENIRHCISTTTIFRRHKKHILFLVLVIDTRGFHLFKPHFMQAVAVVCKTRVLQSMTQTGENTYKQLRTERGTRSQTTK